jgi:hypothetical protein
MQTFSIPLALGSLLALATACATAGRTAEDILRQTAASAAAAPSASAAQAPPAARTSGGTSIAGAEPVARGDTVEGVVSAGAPRYYRIELRRGEELDLTWLTRVDTRGPSGGANPRLNILDAMGGTLLSRMEATYATAGTDRWEREDVLYAHAVAGPAVIQVECGLCGAVAVHYRIVVEQTGSLSFEHIELRKS